MKKTISCCIAALVASIVAFSYALETGESLEFAADGYLRMVTVLGRSSQNAYYGTLDSYNGTANATILETADGFRLDIDDWRNGRNISVVKTAAGTNVAFTPKARRTSASCKALTTKDVFGDSADESEKEENGTLQFATRASDPLASGLNKDPVDNEIDVLVAFDKTAIEYLNSKGETPQEAVEKQIAKMNAALVNSGLGDDFKMNLAGTYNVDLDIVKDFPDKDDPKRGDITSAILSIEKASKYPFWKALFDYRNSYGADIVMILTNPDPEADYDHIQGVVGIAIGLENDTDGKYGLSAALLRDNKESAYGFCDLRVCEQDHTFAHEAGHLMGAGHSELLDPGYSDPGPQLFEYSTAMMYFDVNYGDEGEFFYTVMGYNYTGVPGSPIYTEIPYYSSPNLKHPDSGTPLGDEKHDNVRTLRETYKYISQYRVRKNPDAIVLPFWKKSRTLTGPATRAVPEPFNLQGIFELKLGKANAKTGIAKISATLTGLDGKKKKFPTKALNVSGDVVTVEWDGLTVFIQGDEFFGTTGDAGSLGVQKGVVGGEMSGKGKVYVLGIDEYAPGGEVVVELLPTDSTPEPVTFSGKKWNFAKAAAVKLKFDKKAKLYSLVVDETKGRTNKSSMKLNYSYKKGTFSGSFKVYSILTSAKGKQSLKKFTIKATGVVADGQGAGEASIKKPKGGPWTIGVTSVP